jgi:anti-sigma factor RsiW
MENNLHPDANTLERHVMAKLSAAQEAEVESHLRLCEPCRRKCAEIEAYVRAVRVSLRRPTGFVD